MKEQIIKINNIPSIVWGNTQKKVFIYVHGKCQSKEYAESFAQTAEKNGYQTLSFDLPQHGDRVNVNTPCDIWNGISDLQDIFSNVVSRWETISLFGCSIGAFFALHAYKDITFENRYVKEHPITIWKTPTHILFGGKDTLQTESIMKNFTKQFGGILTISQDSEHAFLSKQDKNVVSQWLQNSF